MTLKKLSSLLVRTAFQQKQSLLFWATFAIVSPFCFSNGLTLASTEEASLLARTQTINTNGRIDSLATIFSYVHEDRAATTLYINQLPVLTFLDHTGETSHSAEAIAQQVSETINTLAAAPDFDATKFSVSWQREGEYALLYGEKPFATLNDVAFLADSTENHEQDALIAVNRFRRILGNAAPIDTIANQPKSQNKANAATAGTKVIRTLQGMASWYGPGFHGRRTASGERFNQYALTAAHKTLPFGTQVRVTNLRNGQSVVVRINDRGPYSHGREIDLSKGSAQQIGLVSAGVASVKLEVLGN